MKANNVIRIFYVIQLNFELYYNLQNDEKYYIRERKRIFLAESFYWFDSLLFFWRVESVFVKFVHKAVFVNYLFKKISLQSSEH